MTGLQMYLLTTLDGICNFLVLFLGAGVVSSVVVGIILFVRWVDGDDVNFKWMIVPACVLAFGSISILVPSSRQMAAILIVPKIVNNEKLQQVPDKVTSLALEWLEELRPKIAEKKP